MRIKTSITLPEDLLKSIDRTGPNRSAFIERASRAYLARLEKAKREAKDTQIINANADRLNAEAMDVIGYQFPTTAVNTKGTNFTYIAQGANDGDGLIC